MREVYSKFLKYKLPSRGDVLSILVLGLSINILLSLGPELQRFAFALVEPSSTDLYSSAYGDGIVRFPSFWELWLYHNQPWFLLIGLATGLVGLSVRNASQAIPAMSIVLFVLLSTYDVAVVLLFPELTFEDFQQSLIANALGSVAISGFQAIIIIALREGLARLVLANSTRRIAISSCMLIINFLTGYSILILLKFMFNPLPVSTEVVLPKSTEGWYWPTEIQGADSAAWGFLPSKRIAADLSFDGIDLKLEWASQAKTRARNLEIRLYADCLGEEPSDLPESQPYLRRSGVRTLTVSPAQNEGTVLLNVLGEPERAVSFEPESVGRFWLNSDEETNTNEITHLVSDGDELAISADGAAQFLISLPLITISGDDVKRGPRLISFSIDGERINEKFSPSTLGQEDILEMGGQRFARADLFACRSIKPGDRLTSAVGVSVLIDILPVYDAGSELYSSDQKTKISDASGWFRAKNINSKSVANEFLGKTKMFAMHGSDAKIEINGVGEELNSHESVWISGEMNAYFTANGHVALKGIANKVFVDNKRRSPTAWENLSEGWALTIFSLFLGFIFFAGKPIVKGLQRNFSKDLEF